MSGQPYNLAPDAIAAGDTTGGPGFALARRESVAIQVTCVEALALPTSVDAFRKSLGPGAPTDLSGFRSLIETYEARRAQASTWSETIIPAVLSLAGDVHAFGADLAPLYYPRLLEEAELLDADPDDAQARTALRALLADLEREAHHRSDRAQSVARSVAGVASAAESVEADLVGDGDVGGLVARHAAGCGADLGHVSPLVADIAEQRRIVTEANDAHDRDVVAACTTASYAWAWPVGSVAAPVAAGVYGHRASDAVLRARLVQSRIDALTDGSGASANLLVVLDHAAAGASALVRALTETLPVIQRVRGVWGGIAADLRAIGALVDTDASVVPSIIAGLDVDEALRSWSWVAGRAQAYRLTARVEHQSGPASMRAWQLANQVSSARLRPVPAMAA